MTKGSDLLVAALENEGVDRIFGMPGEENLDVVESLRTSKIELVLTRHEQAAAFMAATQGRLTGRPGVCLSTLGPGALNFTTGAAYAHLGAMPMLMITGQKAIKSARQARFQIVDIVGAMRPLTKMTRQIVSAASIPTIVRDAFRVARGGAAGAGASRTAGGHRRRGGGAPLVPPHPIDARSHHPTALERAAAMILRGEASADHDRRRRQPAAPGRAAVRFRAATPAFPSSTRRWARAPSPAGSNLYLGTAALSERDYVHDAIDRADLIIAIGHDTVEKPPFLMGRPPAARR